MFDNIKILRKFYRDIIFCFYLIASTLNVMIKTIIQWIFMKEGGGLKYIVPLMYKTKEFFYIFTPPFYGWKIFGITPIVNIDYLYYLLKLITELIINKQTKEPGRSFKKKVVN